MLTVSDMAFTAILGKKIGMTQVYDETGTIHPVTVVQAGPCSVLQVKSAAGKDGYNAVQLGYGEQTKKATTKPLAGHFAKSGSEAKTFIREIRVDGEPAFKAGDAITVAGFEEAGVKFVDVIGVSKGKGFQGVMRRWGFGGQPASHGTERKHRSPGSISMGTNRGHGGNLKKGKKMAGHWGTENVTSKHNGLVKVDVANNLLLIRGSVPGANGSYVIVQASHTKQVKKA